MSAAARASFPAARARFERGLPPRHTFFVSTWLRDSAGRQELVFIEVVRGYAYRQAYTFTVADLVDWMVARPDGSEEGNEVGKFLDTYMAPAACADSSGAG
jgi:hypothetical protein